MKSASFSFAECRRGFTMVELTIATTLSAAIVAGVLAAFIHLRRAYWSQSMVNDIQQNVRVAIDGVAREVRMAGYGVTVPDSELSQWFTWGPGVTSRVHITQGATTADPDVLHIVGATEPPAGRLSLSAIAGDTTLTLKAGEGTRFDASTKKVVLIGKVEMARVRSVSGDQLTISTTPSWPHDGLAYDHAVGTPVELVKIVSYSCGTITNTTPSLACLMRNDNTGDLSDDVDRIFGVGISDFQVTAHSNVVRLALTGRTSLEDERYTHPEEADGYRRTELNTMIRLRNLAP